VITVATFCTGVAFTKLLLVPHLSDTQTIKQCQTSRRVISSIGNFATVSSRARGQEIAIRFAAAEREGNDLKDFDDVCLKMAQAKAIIWP
jgi:hypothetical protein